MAKTKKHGEGSIQEYRPGRFRIRYTTKDGERRSKAGFLSEKEAKRALREVLTAIDRHEYMDERRGEILFRDYAEQYIELRRGDVAEGTYRNWMSLMRTTILPTFGHQKLNDITDGLVEVWWSRNAHRKVNRRNAFFLAAPIMQKAVRKRIVRSNPFDVIPEPGAKVHRDRPTWSTEELRLVLENAAPFVVPMLWVKFAGHLRISELAGLNRADYDTKTGKLRIERQDSTIGGRHLTQTKTRNRRHIELLAPGRKAMDAYIASHAMLPTAPLFTGPKGGRISTATVRRAWIAACAEAGVTNFHLHDIKAVSLTVYAQSGADIRDIMERGGHTSYAAALTYQRTSSSRDAELTAITNDRLRAAGL